MLSPRFEPSDDEDVEAIETGVTADDPQLELTNLEPESIPIQQPHKSYTLQMCPFRDCGKIFDQPSALKRHWNSHRATHRCTICGKAFTQKRSLNEHLKLHQFAKPLACVYCSKSYSSEARLKTHLLRHVDEAIDVLDRPPLADHDYVMQVWMPPDSTVVNPENDEESTIITIPTPSFENEYPCPYAGCPKVCKRKGALRNHIRSHVKENEKLGITSSQDLEHTLDDAPVDIQTVIASMTSTGPHNCHYPKCGKVFKNRTGLINHLQVHPDTPKPRKAYELHPDLVNMVFSDAEAGLHLCMYPDCGKFFAKKQALYRHMGTHAPAFACEYCEKSFATKYLFRDHLTTHLAAKPFKCTVCGKSYRSQRGVKIHRCRIRPIDEREEVSAEETRAATDWLIEVPVEMDGTPTITNVPLPQIINKPKRRRAEVPVPSPAIKWPFKCDLCSVGFNENSNLRKHYKRFHSGVYANEAAIPCAQASSSTDSYILCAVYIKCDLCNIEFTEEKKLQKHLECFHSGRYEGESIWGSIIHKKYKRRN